MAAEGKRILLVEDDPDDRLLVGRAFAKAGISSPLSPARDGDEAVAYLAGEGVFADREANTLPALVLLDLKLPRRSGLEVLGWLRSRPAPLGRTPVVVLTSSGEGSDVDRAYERGSDGYLVKPVDFDGLLRMMEAAGLFWTVRNWGPTRD